MSEGSWSIFVTRPLSLLFLVLTVVFTAYSVVKMRKMNNAAKESGMELDDDK